MRKSIKFKILGLAVIMVSIIACETAEQDVEPVVSPDGYPVATFTNATGTTVTEGDTIKYLISIDKMIDRALTFSFIQTGGTASDHSYVTNSAVLSPYTLSTELSIITLRDYDFTASKTLNGEIGVFGIADRYLLNPSTMNPTPTFTINNYVSPDLEVAFSWDQEVLIDGDPYDAADYIDFDFYVADADGFDIDDPWSNELGIYDAATGSHPEELTLSGLPDGEYILFVDLWENGFAGESNDTARIAITTSFTRQGTSLIDNEIVQDESKMLVADQDVPYNAVLAKIVIAAGKYTIIDAEDNTIGTYKGISTKARRPASIPKTR